MIRNPFDVMDTDMLNPQLLALSLFAELVVPQLHAETPPPFEAGFQRIWMLDPSRVNPRHDESAGDSNRSLFRPLRVDIWRPGKCVSTVMTLADYVDDEPDDAGFDDLTKVLRDWEYYSYGKLAGAENVKAFLSQPTAGCRTFDPAPGRFPVIVYSAGWYNRTPDNLRLASSLAAAGFVVVSVPQFNPALWTYQFATDPKSVENQLRDIEVALGRVLQEPFADSGRVAAMGYSTGADIALLLKGRNPLIDAMVSLDGSWSLADDSFVDDSVWFTEADPPIPMLALRRPIESVEAVTARLQKLGPESLLVEIPGADHGTFSDDAWMRELVGEKSGRQTALHRDVLEVVTLFLKNNLAPSGEEKGVSAAIKALGWRVIDDGQ